MSDTASLKISINTSEVKTANQELDKLTKTSARTEQSTNGVTSSFFSLGRVLSSMALLGTTQQFIKMADTMTGVESKLKLVTNNTLDLVIAQQELFQISQTTRQGYAETVNTYSNFALAMGEMGKSQKDILRVTETVNKAIAISGGTAQMAAAATMQLGQAFASGTLRGDELNSILENSKGLAQAIADGMGVPIGKLRTLGSEGKITAEILANALDKSAQSVDNKFGKVGVTVDASMTVLANSITNMIGKVDKQLGATGSLGKLITDVSKHIDENTQDWVDSVQEAMDTMYPVAEAGFTNIRDLSEVTFEGVNALFSVMVHAFDGAIDSMDNKYRELGFFDYMSLGFIVVIEGFRQIASGGLSALTFLGKQFNTFQSIALDAIAGVMGAMGKFQNAVGGDGSSFLEAQAFWADKANKVKQDGLLIDRTQKAILDDMGKGVDRLIGSYDKLAIKKVKAKKVDTDTGDTGSGKKGGATAETEEQKKAREKAAKEAEKLNKERINQTKELNKEIELLNASEYEKQQIEIEKSVEKYREAGVDKTKIAQLVSLKQGELLEAEYNKSEEQFAKLDKEKYQSALKQIESSAQMYQIMNEISNDWYANEVVNISNRAAAFALAGQSDISILKYVAEATQGIDARLAIESIDEMNDALSETNDVLSGFNDFGANIDGIAGKIGNLAKTISDMSKNNSKFINKDIDNQKKYAKAFLNAHGDVEKEKIAIAEFDNQQNKLKNEQFNAEIAAYMSIAGNMASMFEEGSKGAKAFGVIQATLGIINAYTAITNAMATPPAPAGIALAATVASAVMPIVGTLMSLGGSGGGGGSASSISLPEAKSQAFESETSLITDRLDRQIELLEKIGRVGDATFISIEAASINYSRGLEALSYDVGSVNIGADRVEAGIKTFFASMVNAAAEAGLNIGAVYSNGAVKVNTSSLAGDTSGLLTFIESIQELISSPITQFKAVEDQRKNFSEWINEAQQLTNDYALSLLDISEQMKDASTNMRDFYDELTGTNKFYMEDLAKATEEVNKLMGSVSADSLQDYLQKTIDNMAQFRDEISQSDFLILMSQDVSMLGEQAEVLDRLAQSSSTALSEASREALNYIDSIELVSQAMITSRENIESFVSSLRSTEENAQALAESMGVNLATSVEGLASLFNQLAFDTDGLNDSELELLNTNKDLLENTDSMQKAQEEYNKTLQDTTKSISTLDGALGTIRSTIEKLRSASRTSEQNLQVFYDAMAEAQRLSKTDDYAAYADAVKKAADTSSALLNKDNFTLSRDMEFAQLVAANQFEELGNTTLTQIDYLKQIEINTRTQIDVLVAAMESLGASINSALLQKISMNQSTPLEEWVGNTWTSSGGAVATGSAGNFNIATTQGTNISSQEAIGFVSDQLATGNPMAVYTAALANGISSNSLEAMMGWASGTANDWAQSQGLPSFAVGTPYVPNDMIAQIHKGEMIVPKPEAEAWRNGSLVGNQAALVSELQKNNNLLNGIITKQDQQIQILLESRDIQNGSLVVLENVEGII